VPFELVFRSSTPRPAHRNIDGQTGNGAQKRNEGGTKAVRRRDEGKTMAQLNKK
jgi:hypothetical protein